MELSYTNLPSARHASAHRETKTDPGAGVPAAYAGADAGALIDRVQKLRVLLPAFAQETATARREVARLRIENAKLRRRVAELEGE
jgi:hypothetical protein